MTDASEGESEGIWARLRRRKVVQWGIAYAAGAWGLLQGLAYVTDTFHWPERFQRLATLALLIGLPIAVVLAWYHGDRGEQRVSRTELVILTLLFLVGGGLFWRYQQADDTASVATPSAPIAPTAVVTDDKSIAVLPFDNLSSDSEQGYFADGLTEEILNALASVPGLMVTARTSSFHFKDKDVPVDEIGARLGVEHILEGSVRRSGDQLRVTAQLVRAHDGFHLWSQTYDRPFSDAFAVQSDIAEQVATALGILLDDKARARMNASGVRDPQAYALYARGGELFRAAHNGAPQIPTLMEANRFFDQAVAAAPTLWAAHYDSADLYAHILLDIAAGADPALLPAAEVAKAGEQLRARLGAASASAPNDAARDFIQVTQQLQSDDWRGLDVLLRRAYAHTEACGFDQWLEIGAPLGLHEEAGGLFRRGMQCNALDAANWEQAANAAMYSGKPQAAIELMDRALAMPELAFARLRLHATKAMALLAADRLEEARAESLRGGRAGLDAVLTETWLVAAKADTQRLDSLRAQVMADPSLKDQELHLAARSGDREAANRIAAAIDARPSGPMRLLRTTYVCLCGAPFDIEATPNFAARLQEAGLPWPPTSPIDWPLKDW